MTEMMGSHIVFQDSLTLVNSPGNTAEVDSTAPEVIEKQVLQSSSLDTAKKSVVTLVKADSGQSIKKPVKYEVNIRLAESKKNTDTSEKEQINSVSGHEQKVPENTKIFNYTASYDKKFQYAPQSIWQNLKTSVESGGGIKFYPHIYIRSQLNWTLFIALISIVLLIGLKSYYRKFVDQVINTMINFQLADKLLREKNILVRRAFFMLNINFLLIFSLFLLLLMNIFNVSFSDEPVINYLIILSIVSSILLVRLILYYLVAFIFEWKSAISQQIHSSYLINKNIGLLLLPLVFAAIYTSQSISKILIYTGLGLFLLASVFKLIRGFQIILRNGILLFYAFLYLCTLELLPWVIGSKLVIYLR